MKNTVIFDLDGVLIDSRLCMQKSWTETAEIYKIPDFSNFFPEIGRPMPDILKKIGVVDNIFEISEFYFSRTRINFSKVSIYPFIKLLLDELKLRNLNLGIVTSKSRINTIEIVNSFSLPFSELVCGDDNLPGKPSPQPLLSILSRFKSDPQNSLYVGDMSVDWECARSANVDFYFAEWGYGEIAEKEPCHRLNFPMDLMRYLES